MSWQTVLNVKAVAKYAAHGATEPAVNYRLFQD